MIYAKVPVSGASNPRSAGVPIEKTDEFDTKKDFKKDGL